MSQERRGLRITVNHRTRGAVISRVLLCVAILAGFAGCTAFRLPTTGSINLLDRDAEDGVTISQRAEDATRVSNPPAQHIRFNGNEHLLGGGSCQALPPHELLATIKALRKSSKHRSARLFIQLHKRSAQRLLLEKPSGAADPDVLLVAATLDQFSATSLWTELLHQCASQPELAERWQSRVHEFRTNASGLTEATARQLKLLADQLASPLLQIEALRLEGQLQIASEETPSAIESLVSGAELATTMDTSGIASDLWLMACEASLRVDAVEQARKCWAAAVSSHLDSLQVREDDLTLPSIDTVFWEQAARLIHPGDSFPDELVSTMEPWCARIGIQTFHALTPETSLWSAISEYQIATGQPHLASLSLKRADAHATEQTRPLLQIALARAMAAQGEQAVAATILGKESASKDPNVRASALAVLGAIKIQSGAYEQGTRFVSEALSIDEATQWPGQLSARADLANVQMIVGDIDDALPALHAVQAEMLGQRKWQSLCQSLENEAAILEVEGRNKEAKAIRRRIHEINQLPQ